MQTVRHTLGWFSQDTCQTLKQGCTCRGLGAQTPQHWILHQLLVTMAKTHTCLWLPLHPLVLLSATSIFPRVTWKTYIVTGSTSFTVHQLKRTKWEGKVPSLEHGLREWFSWNAEFPLAQKLPFNLKVIKDYCRVPINHNQTSSLCATCVALDFMFSQSFELCARFLASWVVARATGKVLGVTIKCRKCMTAPFSHPT